METADPTTTVARPESLVETFVRRWQGGEVYCTPQRPGILTTVPYPGLRSFRVDMNRFFCGRENQKQDLKKFFADRRGTEAGSSGRMTFVVGGSGSGKSSLTRAGLIAELNSIPIEDQWGAWYVIDTRPETDPVQQLLDSLWQLLRPFVELSFGKTGDASDGKGDFSERPADEKAASVKQAGERIATVARGLGIEWADNSEAAEGGVRRWLARKISPRPGTISASALFDFVDNALKAFDGAASFGVERSVSPLLFLHIDQFEEVFRDECDAAGREALIKLVRDIHDYKPERLFAVATMRSEEIHRFSEYAGMSQVINSSMYLVDLVAGEDIESVIVDPAQRLARLWQLPLDIASNRSFAPYTQETVRALQNAYWQAGDAAVHTADRLPLLQHMLPLVWQSAVNDWIRRRDSDAGAMFEIGTRHLETVPGWVKTQGEVGKSQLERCLNANANGVFTKAKNIFVNYAAPNRAIAAADLARNAEDILRAAFTALAQLDDNGKPVRRFVTIDSMLQASGGAERLGRTDGAMDELRSRLADALGQFVTAGMIEALPSPTPGDPPKYNVTHEAFIRNWGEYRARLEKKNDIETAFLNTAKSVQSLGTQHWTESKWLHFGLAAKVAEVIPAVNAYALDEIFADDAPYSQAWAQGVLGAQMSSIGAQMSSIEEIRQARLWAKWWERHGKSFKRNINIITRVSLFFVISSFLIFAMYSQGLISHFTLLTLEANEAISPPTRSVIHDRMLEYVIQRTYTEYASSFGLMSKRQKILLREIAGSIDEATRRTFGSDMNIQFLSMGIGTEIEHFKLKDELAACRQLLADDQPGEGWLCQSSDREWNLWFGTRVNAVQIWRSATLLSFPRIPSSAENSARLLKLKNPGGFLTRLADPTLQLCAYLFRSAPVIGFWATIIPKAERCQESGAAYRSDGSQSKPDSLGDVILWTTTGLSDPDDHIPAGEENEIQWDQADICKYTDVSARGRPDIRLRKCNKGPFSLDVDLKKIVIFRDETYCGQQNGQTGKTSSLADVSCPNSIEIQYADQDENDPNPAVRATIRDVGPEISGAKIDDGWLWLRYGLGKEQKTKRYLVGIDPTRRMLELRWLGMKWKPLSKDSDDISATEYRIPRSCALDEGCKSYIDQKSDDTWPGKPED
ncbi:hypothetical protein AB6802_17285 [Mesorhizobium sp. RCC_202]|uniref:nSTAND1 domain-containing NTPase n=1 Tax=Mesorhizobium sp. RCC_202 TaxID=3239222 RepID=UPI0035252E9B